MLPSSMHTLYFCHWKRERVGRRGFILLNFFLFRFCYRRSHSQCRIDPVGLLLVQLFPPVPHLSLSFSPICPPLTLHYSSHPFTQIRFRSTWQWNGLMVFRLNNIWDFVWVNIFTAFSVRNSFCFLPCHIGVSSPNQQTYHMSCVHVHVLCALLWFLGTHIRWKYRGGDIECERYKRWTYWCFPSFLFFSRFFWFMDGMHYLLVLAQYIFACFTSCTYFVYYAFFCWCHSTNPTHRFLFCYKFVNCQLSYFRGMFRLTKYRSKSRGAYCVHFFLHS